MRKATICLPALAAMLAHAAAQPAPSPEQARALQDQIQADLQNLTGSTLKLPGPPVQVTVEGDHYLLRVPLAPVIPSIEPADAAFTAKAHALEAGRWAIDAEQYPPEMKFTTAEHLKDQPDSTGTLQIKLGTQDRHALYDPNGTTVYTTGGSVAPLDAVKTGGRGASLTHIGQFTTQSSIQRRDPAHYDAIVDAVAQSYAVQFELTGGDRGEVTAERLHITTTTSSLALQPLLEIVRIGFQLSASARSPGHGPELSPADRSNLHALLLAARSLLGGGRIDEEADGLKFTAGSGSGGLRKFELTAAADAPQDMLSANVGLTLDGLALDSVPPNLVPYVPSHVTFRPTIANLSVADLTKIALDATAPVEPGGAPAAAPDSDYAALFSHGGIKLGFDQFAFETADVQLGGTGSFTLSNPQSLSGAAEITAHGLDALIARMQGDPLAARAVPAVIFMKGIARTAADQSVWQITVDHQKVLVNGVDLSAIASSMR